MKVVVRSLLLAAASAVALAAATSGAQAGAFAIREQSASAQGLSFAGAASGSGGLSSMFWNPATITMAPGWNQEFHLAGIIPESTIHPTTGTSPLLASPPGSGLLRSSGDIGRDAIVPAGYSSYQFSDTVWIGLATTAPFGLVTKPERNYPGSVYGNTSRIVTYNANAIVGIKVTDWLSIGAGVVGQYFDVRLTRALGVAATAPLGLLEGDDIGFGFTAGATITPFEGTTVGIGYRSSIHQELEGTQRIPGTVIPVRVNLNTPDMLHVGLSQAITPDFRVHFGFEWQNWSRLGTPAIVADANTLGLIPGTVVNTLPLNYRDGYFYSFGAEYDVRPDITLRAGVAYEESPITTEVRSVRLPDNDRVWASIGATYRYSNKLSFDLSYTHVFVRDTRIDIRPGHQDFIPGLPLVANVDSQVNIVSAAVRYRWDNPTVAIPAPVITKY